jgi:tetratricopeptide (TPR) repeat protein
MRSLLLVAFILAACGGRQVPADPSAKEFDPELFEACSSEDGFAPRYCVQDAEGVWTTARPPSNLFLQGKSMLEGGQYEAAVMTFTRAMPQEDECGKQYATYLRGEANFRLGRYKESFIDFASVVRDGPENPFYGQVGAWLKALEPHVERGAMMTCIAMYDPPVVDPAVKGKDEHWKSYTEDDPAP